MTISRYLEPWTTQVEFFNSSSFACLLSQRIDYIPREALEWTQTLRTWVIDGEGMKGGEGIGGEGCKLPPVDTLIIFEQRYRPGGFPRDAQVEGPEERPFSKRLLRGKCADGVPIKVRFGKRDRFQPT